MGASQASQISLVKVLDASSWAAAWLGSEDQEARVAQRVGHACGQGGFGADDDEIDGVAFGEFQHLGTRLDVQVRAFRQLGDARIARRDDQPVAFRVLSDGPCQRMFTPATAQDQDIHLPPFRLILRRSSLAREGEQAAWI